MTQRITTKVLYATLLLGTATTQAAQPKPEAKISLTKTTVQAMENTTQAIKKNQACLAIIDEYIEYSENELDKHLETIKKDVPEEQQQAVKAAVQQELKDAEKTFKQLFKHHAKKLENNVTAIIGTETKAKIIQDHKEYNKRIEQKETELNLKMVGKKLSTDIAEANKPLKETLQQLAENEANKEKQ